MDKIEQHRQAYLTCHVADINVEKNLWYVILVSSADINYSAL